MTGVEALPTGWVDPALGIPVRRIAGREVDYRRELQVMAVVNRTPDSFYDRGATFGLDAAVAYVRGLGGVSPSFDSRPARWVAGDAGAGERIYGTTCSGCHGATGQGGDGPALNNPVLLSNATDTFLVETIANGRRGTTMAGFLEPSVVRPALCGLQNRPFQRSSVPPAPTAQTSSVVLPQIPNRSALVPLLTPTQLLLNGRVAGTTSLIVFYPGRVEYFDIVVHPGPMGNSKARLVPAQSHVIEVQRGGKVTEQLFVRDEDTTWVQLGDHNSKAEPREAPAK